jgi:hypothetical protein
MRTPVFTSFLAALLFSQSAWAQESPPPQLPRPTSPAPAPGPDVVRLKDGSLFRGTIIELVAGDHVDLVVASGETRRFPIATVEYAGSAQAAAAPAPAAVAPPPAQHVESGDKVELKVEANEPEVEVQVKTGQANLVGMAWVGGSRGGVGAFSGTASAYSTLCIAPCRTSLPVGSHRLGLSMGNNSSVVEVLSPVTITGPGTLRAEYESRRGIRIAGLVIAVTADVIGLGMAYGAFASRPQQCDSYGFCMKGEASSGLIYGGLAVAAIGTIVGFVLALQGDKAAVTFVPGAPSPVAGRGGMETVGATSTDLRGGMMRVRF